MAAAGAEGTSPRESESLGRTSVWMGRELCPCGSIALATCTVKNSLVLEVLGCRVRIEAADQSILETVRAAYGEMRSEPGPVSLRYRFARSGDSRIQLVRNDADSVSTPNGEDLIWELDGDLAVEIQKLRSELYFLHAAVVAYEDHAYAFVAEAGSGKSTLCWALLSQGCGYLSDELCPIDMEDLSVHPFPRALSLKSESGPTPGLPARRVPTQRAILIPTEELPAPVVARPLRLGGVFCLSHDPAAAEPALRPLGAAEAATRLYVNALNPLAHPAEGLDGAIRIATSCRCFDLVASSPQDTCERVLTAIRASQR